MPTGQHPAPPAVLSSAARDSLITGSRNALISAFRPGPITGAIPLAISPELLATQAILAQ
jgi:hypothetical protein